MDFQVHDVAAEAPMVLGGAKMLGQRRNALREVGSRENAVDHRSARRPWIPKTPIQSVSTAAGAVNPDTDGVIVRSKFVLQSRLGLAHAGRDGLWDCHGMTEEW